jgi:hypothetical protein
MKTLQYKIIIALLSIGIAANAQKFDKKYTEEFNTKDNVTIDLNTRHTDIEIETWNKNKVVIEATIEIVGATEERAKEIIKNWQFKALGNTNEIEIISKTYGLYGKRIIVSENNDLIHINDLDFDFVVPEVSVGNLAILDSLHIVMPDAVHFPELMVIPEMNDFNFSFDSLSFDYEKYKNDENYLKQWQEEMKKNLAKMRIELKENSVRMKENTAQLQEELKAAQEERKIQLKEHAEQRKEAAKQRQLHEEMRREALIHKQKKQEVKRRDHLESRKRDLAERRIEIKNILADRDKIKINRVIKIKAPKGAKFTMDVSYGSVRYPN